MNLAHQVLTVVAILATAVIYGTDVFCALVQRAALARLDDQTVGTVMGFVHRYGDRRLPAPGVIGLVAALLAGVAALLHGHVPVAVVADGVAVLLLVAWLVIYARISAPINKVLTRAAEAGDALPNARELQGRWDSVINLRATLQGAAVLALLVGVLTV